jgi:hypothetical protein
MTADSGIVTYRVVDNCCIRCGEMFMPETQVPTGSKAGCAQYRPHKSVRVRSVTIVQIMISMGMGSSCVVEVPLSRWVIPRSPSRRIWKLISTTERTRSDVLCMNACTVLFRVLVCVLSHDDKIRCRRTMVSGQEETLERGAR